MPVLNENGKIPSVDWVKAFRPLLDEGFSLSITPQGTSMVPFVCGGRDSVLLKSPDISALRRGDIILYPDPNGDFMILHRIHHIKNGFFVPLGDSRTDIEAGVPSDDVYAVATEIVRKGKRISCDNPRYRFLVLVWLAIRSLRPLIFRLWRRYIRLRYALFTGNSHNNGNHRDH